ncbi:MAG TPA: aldehyde reductase [Solirubrobacterales bacterium]|nr:aldehyde reductase [Solirubrobacterales bacterium]
MSETVLVSGGSGFLGGWCIVELLGRGYEVRTTVRDLSREAELREAVGSRVDAGERLSVLAADLTRDEGWGDAVAGCDYVLHVASPFPPVQPKDPDELIVPAREGTLRVLRAAFAAGAKRTVVTSSVAAIAGGARGPGPLTEADWTDLDFPGLSPYVRSKTIAEQAAWELAEEEGTRERLAVVNPGAILGPLLHRDPSFSLQAVQRLLKGMPGVPRIGFSFVDVRDVADLQVKAMLGERAGGERFIAVDEFLWLAEVAAILRRELGAGAKKVPTRKIPDFLVKVMGRFDPSVGSIVNQLGKKLTYSSEKARTELGWAPRPVADSIADTGRSMVELGLA